MAKLMSIIALALALSCVSAYFAPVEETFTKKPVVAQIPTKWGLVGPYDKLVTAITHFNKAEDFLTLWNFQDTSVDGSETIPSKSYIKFNGNDIVITKDENGGDIVGIPLPDCQKPLALPNGYFAFACTKALYTLEAATGNVVKHNYDQFKQAKSDRDQTPIKTMWFQDDFLYVLFVNQGYPTYTYYIQGVRVATPGVSRFHSGAIQLYVANGANFMGAIKCGQIGKEDKAVCSWTIPGKAVAAEIDFSANTVGSMATLALDPTSDIHYIPKKVITLDSSYVIILSNFFDDELAGCVGDLHAKYQNKEDPIKLGLEDRIKHKCPVFVDATSNGDSWNVVWQKDDWMPGTYLSQYDAIGNSKGPSTLILKNFEVLNFVTLDNNSHYILFYNLKTSSDERGIYFGQLSDITANSAFLELY